MCLLAAPAPRSSQPLLACLLLRFAALAAADTPPRNTTRHTTHHSRSDDVFPLSDDHPLTPHYIAHIHQPAIILYPSTIARSKPLHPLFTTLPLPARTALCRPRSLALHIAPPIHIPASASRIHPPARHAILCKLSSHPRTLFKATTAYSPACPTPLVSFLFHTARRLRRRRRHEFRIH